MEPTPPPPQVPSGSPKAPRRRRTSNYWEPFFDPNDRSPFPFQPWDFNHNLAPSHVTFTAEQLKAAVKQGLTPRFDGIRFAKCDFSGQFDLSPRDIVFKDCRFEDCDFGLSVWTRAKFTNCTLQRASLTQSKWIECDFRGCSWEKIGISGNETAWDRTTITNPGEFIRAAYTNLEKDVLARRRTTPDYQRMRLESTKATVARALSRMFLDCGDEGAFYDALKCSSNQSTRARIYEALYNLQNGNFISRARASIALVVNSLDWTILNAAGFVNAWGRSIARPTIIGVLIMMLFSAIYYKIGSSTWLDSLVKAIEITLLIGYTNHSGSGVPIVEHCLVLINMVAGLLWYVVFIPTLVNRISRIR